MACILNLVVDEQEKDLDCELRDAPIMRFRHISLCALGFVSALSACGPTPPHEDPDPQLSVDEQIAQAIADNDLEPLAQPAPQDPAKVELGRALYFDKILSGNRDTSCASCHHPRKMTGDDKPLSAGTGAIIDGEDRRLGDGRTPTARNSPEVFNRGVDAWSTQFWDMRVRVEDGVLLTPAGSRLPDGLDSVLAAQAMFPVTARDEMRGERWDEGVDGHPNELGPIVDGLLNQIWDKLMVRLLDIAEYRQMFAAAYPDVPADELGFQHAANAIAAFEIDAFSFSKTPWDRYVAGEADALDDAQKRGAALFFGKAGCAECHSGNLFTDQKAHNLAVPQFGPGKSPDEPFDLGYGRVSNDRDYNFAFRTPTLRNVEMTPPYMHNGAYETLEGAVRHHLHPARSLRDYDPSHLDAALRESLHNSAQVQARILETLDAKLDDPPELSDAEIGDLIAFMKALNSTHADECMDAVPESVPSGLPLD